MKILITGISGFVARHFVEYLSSMNEPVFVAGIHHSNSPSFEADQFPHITCRFTRPTCSTAGGSREILMEVNPDFILHLASKAVLPTAGNIRLKQSGITLVFWFH